MKTLYHIIIFASFLLFRNEACSLSISSSEIDTIGERIWENECGKKIEGLTHWNNGEDFGSFGIGHFIWYPEGKQDRFQETFPDLIKFLQNQGIVLPTWLSQSTGCPWISRDDFYEHIQDPKMVALRQILYETRNLQAMFIAVRLEKSLPEMINSLPKQDKDNINSVFSKLASSPKGLYALIDYSNFKGIGTSSKEEYHGQGWGLLQVLKRIPPKSKNVVADFAKAAKEVLVLRIKNSPPERHEEKWLKGWLNRVDTYDAVKP